jgi:hypothetical protein
LMRMASRSRSSSSSVLGEVVSDTRSVAFNGSEIQYLCWAAASCPISLQQVDDYSVYYTKTGLLYCDFAVWHKSG